VSEARSLLDTAIDYERAKRRARRIVDAEEAPPRDPLTALTLPALFERPRPDYLIDCLIPEGSLCQLVGPPETLKSFFACHSGLAIASGLKDCFGYPVIRHGPVLDVAAEGGGAFQYRVRAWCHAHGVDPAAIPFRVIAMPVDLRDGTCQTELRDIVAAEQPILIVFDTLSRCTPGAEENSARDMGEAVAFCTQLQAVCGSAIVLVHHPTKEDPRGGGRGSGAVLGAVDTELRASTSGEPRPDGSRLIQITCAKQKDDMKPPPLSLIGFVVPVRDLEGRAMTHRSGRPITTLLLRVATEEDERGAAQAEASALEAAIVGYLRAHSGGSKKEIQKGVGKNRQAVADEVDRLADVGKLELVTSRGRGGAKQTYVVRAAPLKDQREF
jgi:hypothetical protein